MDYNIGIALILFISGISYFVINKIMMNKYNNLKNVKLSQSYIHSLISPYIPKIDDDLPLFAGQVNNDDDRDSIKVIIIDNSAYWIKDNTFYTAFVDDSGMVDKDTTRIVDTMTMDAVELDKMLFIMDRLREGLTNDSGSSGQ